MSKRITIDNQAPTVGEMQIRQLIDMYPASMEVLDRYGMDMCCGGDHTLVEAARLHGFDPDTVVAEVTGAIQHDQS